MILVVSFSIILALAPVFAFFGEDLYGSTVTLSRVGLAPETSKPEFVGMQNMDVGKIQWTNEELENEGKEEGEGNNIVGEQHVIKGMPVYTGTFQFQAALVLNTTVGYFYWCGAVIIAPRRAITAAHCLSYFSGNITFEHFIAVGITNRTRGLLTPGSQMVPVIDIEIHHRYEKGRGYNIGDIAMLYLGEDVVENRNVHFASLASPEMGNFEHYYCVISGWGQTENGRPEVLQFGYQFISTYKECVDFWAVSGGKEIVSRKHICGYDYPTSGCYGDSGGPLTCGEVVVGLVSWGLASCSGCFPSVYTRISTYYDWITMRLI